MFSHEDFLLRLERKQIDHRLKAEAAEKMQEKLDGLGDKVDKIED